MKVYIYQRLDFHSKMNECISWNKKDVIQFMNNDLDSIGCISNNDPEFSGLEPNDLLDVIVDTLIGEIQREMIFIRFNEIDLDTESYNES